MLRYTMDIDDLLAYNQFWYSKSPVIRFHRRKRLAIIAGVYGVTTIVIGLYIHPYGIAVLSGLILLAFWLWDLYVTRKPDVKRTKELYAKDKNLATFGEHQLEMTADGVRGISPVSEGVIKFTGIEGIENTDSYVYIIIGSAAAFIISRNKVLEGNLDEFVAALKAKMRK